MSETEAKARVLDKLLSDLDEAGDKPLASTCTDIASILRTAVEQEMNGQG